MVDQYSQEEVQVTFSPSSSGNQSGVITLENINPGYSGDTGDFTFTGYGIDLSDGVVLVPSEVPTIQEAIDAAGDGDQILVANGVYYENLVINKSIRINGENQFETIIDGNGNGSVIYFGSGAGNEASLSDLTVQNGTGQTGQYAAGNGKCGGGIFLDDGASPALLGILVKNNQAESRGAGIFKNTGATLRISNSIIAGNFGTEGYQCNGAGIGGDGGGEGSLIYRCTIENNHSTYEGGGIYLPDNPIIVGTIFSLNTSVYGASALYSSGASISNCTFIGNGDVEDMNGDPVLMKLDGPSSLQNSIVWDNDPSFRTIRYGGELSVQYSIIQGLQNNFQDANGFDITARLDLGEGNLSQNPLLNGDLSFQIGSPAINAGNPNGFYIDSDGTRNDIGNSGGNHVFVKKEVVDFGNVDASSVHAVSVPTFIILIVF